MERYYPYWTIRIPVSQFTSEGGYYLKILSDPSKTFLLSLGGSAIASCRNIKLGRKDLVRWFYAPTQRRIYLRPGYLTLEIETYLTDRIVLLLTERASSEVAEIRCQIGKEGDYQYTQFYIRYFQVDGKGELWLDNGIVLLPNDLYPLDKETFRMYYTSHCTDQQVIDVYIENNHGQVVQKTFSFQNDKGDEEELPTNMMTMMVISYVVAWLNIVYALITAPSDIELWGEEIE